MKPHHYTFVTVWHIKAPLEKVWDHIVDIESWPTWWKGVRNSKILARQGEHGAVGSKIATSWNSWLPYSINFVLTITEVDPQCQRLAAKAEGDLNGTGLWEFSEENGITTARYTWDVSTTKPWMNLVAPLAKPIFEHAHDVVMGWGEQGLKRLLEPGS